MKVYLVGHDGPEHNSVESVHKSYSGAFKSWNKLRIELLDRAKYYLKEATYGKEMWERIVRGLSCEDPKKIDNYPHETPYIIEYEVED
jgi:hypothetical protein